MTGNDFDPNTGFDDFVEVVGWSSPAHGTITFNSSSDSFAYQGDEGYIGPDQFVYTIQDLAEGEFATATITLNVLGPLVAAANSYSVVAGEKLIVGAGNGLLYGTPPDQR